MSDDYKDFLEFDFELLERDVKRVQNALDKITNEMIQLMVDELVEFAYGVMGIAMRHAPKETGNLRGSAIATIESTQVAHTEKDENSEYGAKAIRDLKKGFITLEEFLHAYSGAIIFNTSYATPQHENLNFKHVDGEAKFLEKAITSQQPEFAKSIAQIIKKHSRRGGA